MSYSLHYRAERSEIWHWYWRAVRQRFWPVHVFLGLLLAFHIAKARYIHLSAGQYALTFVWVLPLVTACFAVVPQLFFKPSERLLEITPDGWSTTIGRKSGSMPWSKVRSVEEINGALVITSPKGNALIVPRRALPDASSWGRFVLDVRTWHSSKHAT